MPPPRPTEDVGGDLNGWTTSETGEMGWRTKEDWLSGETRIGCQREMPIALFRATFLGILKVPSISGRTFDTILWRDKTFSSSKVYIQVSLGRFSETQTRSP